MHFYLLQYKSYQTFTRFVLLDKLTDYLENLRPIFGYVSEKCVQEDLSYYRSYEIIQGLII